MSHAISAQLKHLKLSKVKPSFTYVVMLLTLLVAMVWSSARADVIAYSVRSDTARGDDNLYLLNLTTGSILTRIGPVGYANTTGLALRTAALFGFDDGTDQLIRINPITGMGMAVVPPTPNVDVPHGTGLTFDAAGRLWLSSEDPPSGGSGKFYSVDPNTGVVTEIGPLSPSGFPRSIPGIAAIDLTIYGIDDDANQLYTIDSTTGVASLVGNLGFNVADVGMDSDSSGRAIRRSW